MTIKLFYLDSYQKEFSANILEKGTANGNYYLILDQSAFYPTGGGQPCDLGEIDGISVTHVEEEEGKIFHWLAEDLAGSEGTVTGKIDWVRRRDHMQQHTGQHILSAAFRELYQADTVGFHLGKETVTVDITLAEVTEEMIALIQERANQIVQENRQIHAAFVTPEEAASLPLHKAPTVTENIRIVTIADYDYNPCGGTHPTQTGEVGAIHVLGWERNKGGTRIEFVCGHRATQVMIQKQSILKKLTQQFSSPEQEILLQVSRILQSHKEMESQIQEWNEKWMALEIQTLCSSATTLFDYHLVQKLFLQRPMQELQKLAQKVTEQDPFSICLFFSQQENKLQMVFASGKQVSADMNQLLKEVLPLIEGKGGGRPSLANGGGLLKQDPEGVIEAAIHCLTLHLTSNAAPSKQ